MKTARLALLVFSQGFGALLGVMTVMNQTSAAAEIATTEEGKKLFFFERVHSKGEKVSCTTCHTRDPKQNGRTRANKEIKPLAPVANPQRLTDPAKMEKWFTRNCMDVLERQCTNVEKESFVLFLKSIK